MRLFDHGRRDGLAAERLRTLYEDVPPGSGPIAPLSAGFQAADRTLAVPRERAGAVAASGGDPQGGRALPSAPGGQNVTPPADPPDWVDPEALTRESQRPRVVEHDSAGSFAVPRPADDPDDPYGLLAAGVGAPGSPGDRGTFGRRRNRPGLDPPSFGPGGGRRSRRLAAALGDLDPGLGGVRVMVAAGSAAALLAGGFLWASRPRPEPVPGASPLRPAHAAAAATPAASAPQPPPDSSPSASVVVHVAGKVRRPGVVTLPLGARVDEAIRAAGGARPGADTGSLNLARRLVDGEQILVGITGPAAPGSGQAGAIPPGGMPGGSGGGAPPVPGTGVAAPGGQLDLNAATLEQLQQLPGVGPVLAQRMLDYRTAHGGYRSVDELRDVTGIGSRRFADLKPLVRV